MGLVAEEKAFFFRVEPVKWDRHQSVFFQCFLSFPASFMLYGRQQSSINMDTSGGGGAGYSRNAHRRRAVEQLRGATCKKIDTTASSRTHINTY